MRFKKCLTIIIASMSLIALCENLSVTSVMASEVKDNNSTGEYSIDFDQNNYTTKTLTVNNKTITYRAYEKIVYVKNPVDTNYEIMNFYVPEEYYEGKAIENFNAQNAPIFFPNSVGGYMPGAPGSPGADPMSGDGSVNAAAIALSKGYVVAEPGARGRTTQNESGTYTGKAPACIVDLKAAVRYLRYNDKIMPGDAEKIISNGTSAGGALSALLGATGNNKDYEPYLKEIGAADEHDDIFAVSSYCPITNLDNADMAYEWLFNGVNDYKRLELTKDTDYKMKRTYVEGTMTEDQIELSNKLAAEFSEYIKGLKLKDVNGDKLGLDENGNGSFKDYVKSFVIDSAQKALESGKDLLSFTWVTIENGKVKDIDFDEYVKYVGRMKVAPAFDGIDLSNDINSLFGTSTANLQHFTKFGMKNNTTSGATMADPKIVKMMNPMNYIGKGGVTTTKNWRIRAGSKDADTSLAISVILATRLENRGCNVDYAVPWEQGHGGDYDLDQLFTWMDKVSNQ
ncbi:alpha/beta hydrolase [Clostridium sp. SHJSY1]|uniref:subtype B tannase n=1 Tax=Clostridium sp. SHJSY1 TaxID=2942483 RepID=UPI00287657F3|nr:subtype B tannase [Clostridium sp. SHJSY1]MDS0525553.1 alpha/beta hydrolase [Clostridium sp. SHJSY1]